MSSIHTIPPWLQPVLWTTHIDLLEVECDKHYIIHQILAYGDLKEFKWLFQTYAKDDVIHTFTTIPYKDYSAARFNFIKIYILNLGDYELQELLYVKNISRDIRYKQTKSLHATGSV